MRTKPFSRLFRQRSASYTRASFHPTSECLAELKYTLILQKLVTEWFLLLVITFTQLPYITNLITMSIVTRLNLQGSIWIFKNKKVLINSSLHCKRYIFKAKPKSSENSTKGHMNTPFLTCQWSTLTYHEDIYMDAYSTYLLFMRFLGVPCFVES